MTYGPPQPGWLLCLVGDRPWVVPILEEFPDSEYETPDECREAAEQYRRELLVSFPPETGFTITLDRTTVCPAIPSQRHPAYYPSDLP